MSGLYPRTSKEGCVSGVSDPHSCRGYCKLSQSRVAASLQYTPRDRMKLKFALPSSPAPPQRGSGRTAGQTRGLLVPVSRGGFRWEWGREGRLTASCTGLELLPETPPPHPPPHLLRDLWGDSPSSEVEAGQQQPAAAWPLGSSPLSAAPGEDLDRPEFESMPHC